jgi:hypothetical protein
MSALESFIARLLGDASASIDYGSLWCLPLFAHPDKVRNVPLADAASMQKRLIEKGVADLLLKDA